MPTRARQLLWLALPMEAGYLLLNRLGDFQRFVVEYIAISFAVSLFYLVFCWQATKIEGPPEPGASWSSLACILLAGLIFRLTVVAVYPTLTDDPYRYRWDGKLQAVGGNPYLARPEDSQWRSLRDRTWPRVNRKELPTGYGPLIELTYRLTYAVVSRLEPDEFRQVRLFKIPFLIFDLGAAAALLMLLKQLGLPRELVAVYFWSPLVILELWGSGHNDSLLLFFLVVAAWAACAGRWVWALGALWMATLTKFWPALLFPLFVLAPSPARLPAPSPLRRLGLALAWSPLAALLALPYWQGAGNLRQMLLGFLGGWRNNASLFNFIYAAAGNDYERAKPVVAVLVIVAVLGIAWRRPPLIQGALWTVTALLFLSANCFPWYLTWLVPLLAVVPSAPLLLWTALVPLEYHILVHYQATGLWQDEPFYLYLEYMPIYGMLVVGWALRIYRRGRRERRET